MNTRRATPPRATDSGPRSRFGAMYRTMHATYTRPMAACLRCGASVADSSRFCSECGAPVSASLRPRQEVRKTVTILFCDVVDSTVMGEQNDPETVRQAMSRYFNEMQAIVEGHGGVVERFRGDEVMAVFGVPTVHEDDALRAVRAGMAMLRRLEQLNRSCGRPGASPWRAGSASTRVKWWRAIRAQARRSSRETRSIWPSASSRPRNRGDPDRHRDVSARPGRGQGRAAGELQRQGQAGAGFAVSPPGRGRDGRGCRPSARRSDRQPRGRAGAAAGGGRGVRARVALQAAHRHGAGRDREVAPRSPSCWSSSRDGSGRSAVAACPTGRRSPSGR